MTARLREDELREVPLWKTSKERWPPGVREIAMEEQDCLDAVMGPPPSER
jgi:hypothetical protein